MTTPIKNNLVLVVLLLAWAFRAAGGVYTTNVNQRVNGGVWVDLGTFTFQGGVGEYIEISNDGANGYVIADAVRFAGGSVTNTIDDEDNAQTEFYGQWQQSSATAGYYGIGYHHDQNAGGDPLKWLRFFPELQQAGEYAVSMRWTANANRATNAAVTIVHGITPVPHTLTVVNGSGSGDYVRRAEVLLVADTPPAGQSFYMWRTSAGGEFEDRYTSATRFTMPNEAVTVTVLYREEVSSHVRESGRALPLVADVDVAVVGASLGAIGTAVGAAQAGASVLLVGPNPYLGQDMAGENRYGLADGEMPASALARELFGTRSSPDGVYYVTPGAFKRQAEKVLETNGVAFLYGTHAVDAVVDANDRLSGVVIANKGGRQAVRAKVVVDATPMGGFAQLAGAEMNVWPTGTLKAVSRTHYWGPGGAADGTIASYVFTGGSPVSTDSDTNSAAGDLTIGSDFGISTSTDTAYAFSDSTTNSEAAAMADADYFAFTVTPNVGSELDLTRLQVDTAYNRGVAPHPVGVPTAYYFMRSSIDGFATNIATFSETFQDSTSPVFTPRTVDLSGAGFQDLTAGITFRIYIYDNSDSKAAARIDNLSLVVGDAPVSDYQEFTTTVSMTSGSWAERCRAEARLRRLFDTGQEAWSAQYMHMVEPRGVVGEASDTSVPWVGAQAVDLGVCKPRNMDYLYVIGTVGSVSRTNAIALARPLEALELGRRLGATAQAAAAGRARPTSLRVAVAPPGSTEPGLDIHESLSGLRPYQFVPRVPQAARALPVNGRYDVVVVGGGSSGAPAAIGAARAGATVLLIEQLGLLGGTGVNGIGKFWRGYRHGFAIEHSANAWLPNAKAHYYREALENAGGEVWYNTPACGVVKSNNVVRGVVVATPMGRRVILGGVVIDGTGDGDVCVWAGADFEFGGGKEGNFALQDSGFHGDNRDPTGYQNQSGVYTDPSDIYGATWFRVLCRRHTTHAGKFDHYPLTGMRSTRRVMGDYVISALDQYRERTYADVIAVASSNWDNHGYHKDKACYAGLFPDGMSFVPYRALLPRGLENALVVGRCKSVEHDALALVRMQSDVANEGYAAGVAAAMCVRDGLGLRDVDMRALQDHLRTVGNLPDTSACPCVDMPDPTDGELQAAAVDPSVPDNMAALLVDPDRSTPFLVASFQSSQSVARAKALCFCGATNGVPYLAAWLDTQALTHDGGNGRVTSIDSVMRSLGYPQDSRAVAALAGKLDACTPNASDYTHVRAAALALGDVGSRDGVPALLRYLERPGVTNVVRTVDEGLAAVSGSPSYVAAAQAAIVAAALYRCGDTNGVAESVLMSFLDDWRGPLRRFAAQVLSYKCSPRGVPYGWFEEHGIATNDLASVESRDTDGDGSPDWQEFWAGTNPRDAGDVLRATGVTPDGQLTWRGGPNALDTPFRIYGGTDLTSRHAWSLSATVPRAHGGTNVWTLPEEWRALSPLYVKPAAPMSD